MDFVSLEADEYKLKFANAARENQLRHSAAERQLASGFDELKLGLLRHKQVGRRVLRNCKGSCRHNRLRSSVPADPVAPLACILDELLARRRQRIHLAGKAQLDLGAVGHLVSAVELGVGFARLAFSFGLGNCGP
jgi:hypothetical protein